MPKVNVVACTLCGTKFHVPVAPGPVKAPKHRDPEDTTSGNRYEPCPGSDNVTKFIETIAT
ncbi:MAG: hypothetical protein HY261_11065 [Chloroflexi bacterium]|nr:hypothetical protein [Chloroflexota bacterium]